MPNVGPMELILVLVVALLVLGPKKLPEVGRSVGKGLREFKSSISGDDDNEPLNELVSTHVVAPDPEVVSTPEVVSVPGRHP
jgi:sec-independent protein translocase protein TatA